MDYIITTDEFKTMFAKDFEYGSGEEQVSDSDITRAMTEASINFNKDLFDDLETQKVVFGYLTAYYLVFDQNNANTGGSGGIGIRTSQTVRNVSESFAVPKWVLDNPMFSMYAQNGYGLKYISLIYPYLIGNVRVVPGATLP